MCLKVSHKYKFQLTTSMTWISLAIDETFRSVFPTFFESLFFSNENILHVLKAFIPHSWSTSR